MPFIWNDDTFWERVKKELKVNFIVLLPLFILNLLGWLIFTFDKITFSDVILLSVMSTGSIFTFINIFFQFPNGNIPDSYSKEGKTAMYILQFIVVSMIFLLFLDDKQLI